MWRSERLRLASKKLKTPRARKLLEVIDARIDELKSVPFYRFILRRTIRLEIEELKGQLIEETR